MHPDLKKTRDVGHKTIGIGLVESLSIPWCAIWSIRWPLKWATRLWDAIHSRIPYCRELETLQANLVGTKYFGQFERVGEDMGKTHESVGPSFINFICAKRIQTYKIRYPIIVFSLTVLRLLGF